MSRRTRVSLIAMVAALVVGVVVVLALTGDEDEPVALEPDEPTAEPDADPDADEEEPSDPDPDEEPGDVDDEPAEDAEADDVAPHDEDDLVVTEVAEGFDQPWGLALLPDEARMLVTELPGRLSLLDLDEGEVTSIDGVPEVDAGGQGGLLDVAVHPDWPEEDWVHLTYAAGDGSGATSTHLARGRLDAQAGALTDVEELFAAEPFLDSTQHYGSRVVHDGQGHVLLTVGDRGDKAFDDHVSQDASNHLGTTIRLSEDGEVPADNPFVDDEAVADEIYSYGHRNVQGMALHPDTGAVWQSEHGEEDGDELNIVEEGANHGWPETHTGCEYGTETPVGVHPSERDDVPDPVYYWECTTGGFPPAGIDFVHGAALPGWEGDLLVGGLASESLARFSVDDDEVTKEGRLLEDRGWRIRDVVTDADRGVVYLAIDDGSAPIVALTTEE